MLDGDIEERNDLTLSSPDFDDGARMPDYVGYANQNENPPLEIDGVPDDAESLVLVLDDPDAEPVVGFTYDHWLAWNVDPDVGELPRGWDSGDAVEGYNDYAEQGYGGPSPPDGSHDYRFKLLALDSALDVPPEARKAVVGMTISMEAEVLASTQLVGEYDASQGTVF